MSLTLKSKLFHVSIPVILLDIILKAKNVVYFILIDNSMKLTSAQC